MKAEDKKNNFRRFLMTQVIGDIRYSSAKSGLTIGEISFTSPKVRKTVFSVGQSEEYNYTEEEINEILSDLVEDRLEFGELKKRERIINPFSLEIGKHIKIFHNDLEDGGRSDLVEDLLKIDDNSFMVIDHDRGSLKCGTILIAKNGKWEINGQAHFKFKSQKKYYQTKIIKRLEVLSPNELYIALNEKDSGEEEVYFLSKFDSHRKCFYTTDFSISKDNDTYIKLKIRNNTGTFSLFSNDKIKTQKLLKSDDSFIKPIAKYQPNLPSERISTISTTVSGIVKLEDKAWKITREATVFLK